MPSIATIIGVILLVVWLYFLRIGRRLLQQQGSLMLPTVFQFNFLPLLLAVALLGTGDLTWLALAPIVWPLAPLFGRSSAFLLPTIIGAVIGVAVSGGSSVILAAALGVVGAIALGAVVFAIVGVERLGDNAPRLSNER